MKNSIVTVSATVLGFIIGYFLVILITGGFKEETVFVPLDTDTNTEMKDGFMIGCMEEGTKEDCTCYYNSVLGQLGYDGLIDLSTDYLKTEQIPTKVIDKIKKDCQ